MLDTDTPTETLDRDDIDQATGDTTTETTAETIPALSATHLPVTLLRAALACVGTDKNRPYLNGVHLSRRDNSIHVAGTDGHRMFVGSHTPDIDPTTNQNAAIPEWLDGAGVTIPSEGLKAMLALFGPGKEEPTAAIRYATGARRIEISDIFDRMTFRLNPLDGSYPDIYAVMSGAAGTLANRESAPLDSVAFNGKYLLAAGELAGILNASALNLFASEPNEAAIITFAGVDGAVLYLMPTKTASTAIGAATAAIIAPALNYHGTLAALRAHQTRQATKADDETQPESVRVAARAKVGDYESRIAAILSGTVKALPAPASEATDNPAPTLEPEAQPAAPSYDLADAIEPEPTQAPAPEADPADVDIETVPRGPARLEAARAKHAAKGRKSRAKLSVVH